MMCGDTRILTGLTDIADDGDVAGGLIQQCHMDLRRVSPQGEQRAAAVREQLDRMLPAVVGYGHTRPWVMPLGRFAMRDAVEPGHDAIPAAGQRSGSQ